MSDIDVKGLAELSKFLTEFPDKLQKNILRSALRAGANEIKEQAKQNLITDGHQKTGVLVDGIKVGTKVKGDMVIASIKTKGKHAYIARWLEFTGAKPHIITGKAGKTISFGGRVFKAINHPGFKKKAFLRPAVDAKAAAAAQAVAETIKAKLMRKGLDVADVDTGEDQ